jgi:hypothetical protein
LVENQQIAPGTNFAEARPADPHRTRRERRFNDHALVTATRASA